MREITKAIHEIKLTFRISFNLVPKLFTWGSFRPSLDLV
jgi:hypothetical protein